MTLNRVAKVTQCLRTEPIRAMAQTISDTGILRASILEMRMGQSLGDQRGAWASWLASDEGLADFGRQLRAKVQQGATWAH